MQSEWLTSYAESSSMTKRVKCCFYGKYDFTIAWSNFNSYPHRIVAFLDEALYNNHSSKVFVASGRVSMSSNWSKKLQAQCIQLPAE